MMDTAILYLGRNNEFERMATWAARETGAVPIRVARGGDLITASCCFDNKSVRRLILIGHGSPTWFLRPGSSGLHRWMDDPPMVVSAFRFADVWAQKVVPGCHIALAACACSRSPKWYLERHMPAFLGEWGVGAYSDGGKLSLAQQLANCFSARRAHATVHGHTVRGHCTDSPCVRAHDDLLEDGAALISMFLNDPTKPPSRAQRRRWNRAFKGLRARKWLCDIGAADVLAELRQEFQGGL